MLRAKDGQSPNIEFSAVMQIERGAVVVRGAAKGVPAQATSVMKSSKPNVDPNKTSGFAVLNIAPLFGLMPLPPDEIIPGVAIADLAKNMNGPISVTMAPGSMDFDLRVPMADTTAIKKLIDQC